MEGRGEGGLGGGGGEEGGAGDAMRTADNVVLTARSISVGWASRVSQRH